MSLSSLIKFTLSLALAPLLHAQDLSADEQKAHVAKLQQHRAQNPALAADFTEEKTTHLLNKPITSNGTIAFQTPNKFRRELKGNSPSLTVCNGSELWIYYPNFKQAEHYTLGQRQSFDDNLAALTAGLNFTDVEKYFRLAAAKDGAATRITLTPKNSSLKRVLTTLTVWLDAEGTVQKTDSTLPKGDRIVTTFRNVRASKQSDAKFDYTPPADAQISTPLGK